MRVTLAGQFRGVSTALALLLCLCGLAVQSACGGSAAGSAGARLPHPATRRVGQGRPPLAVIDRDGDAVGAVAIAVTTMGIAPERGATVAVSLAALVEARLAAGEARAAPPSTEPTTSIVGGWDGWRLRAYAATPAQGAALVRAVRAAMLEPVRGNDVALAAVARKVSALAHRPLADPALLELARCTGEAYGSGGDAAPTAAELESWRRAAHGLGRVAIATTGQLSLADAVADGLLRAPPWPSAAPVTVSPWPPADAPAVVYAAPGDSSPGAARIIVTAHTAAPESAVAAAEVLGDPRGPLSSRLAALEGRARVSSVVAAAHADGGCVATTIELAARNLLSEAPARIATAAALARQEVAGEVADVSAPPDLGHLLATRAPDPREAADRAAWWSLAMPRIADEALRVALTVGVAPGRDEGPPAGTAPDEWASSAVRAIHGEMDRATAAWHSRVVEARTRVERGQGETWVLLASPCGTLPEASRDAGTGAVVAMAAAAQGEVEAGGARVEPFVAPDGMGVLAHGAARAGESQSAHARRLADAAARAFAADGLEGEWITRARTALLGRAETVDARLSSALGGALAPGHPSWLQPTGTLAGLAAISNEAVALRAAALREGPLRVAVLANADALQAETAVRAVDRWIARRPGEARACPPEPALAPILAGTQAVDLAPGATPTALLALPLADDAKVRGEATWIAAALDGADGLLARALGPANGAAPETALARSWNCAVVGAPRNQALVIRLVAPEGSLDAAVAQTRSLLDRLRRGAFREEDRSRAAASLARASVAVSLDPRARVIELWRGDFVVPPSPTLDALRAFAAATLRDEALVLLAARAPRVEASERPSPVRLVRDPNAKGRL